jgi:hypothetical protein
MPFIKAIDVVSNADNKNLPEPGQRTCPRVHRYERVKDPVPKSPSLDPVYRTQLLSAFIGVYLPEAAQGPTIPGQTPASWVHILPDLTPTNPAYNTSLAALCVAQLGTWNHDLALMKESLRLYGTALGELRKTISSRKLVAPEATLACIVILSTYEVSLIMGWNGSGH